MNHFIHKEHASCDIHAMCILPKICPSGMIIFHTGVKKHLPPEDFSHSISCKNTTGGRFSLKAEASQTHAKPLYIFIID
jgi:hypothetical protein